MVAVRTTSIRPSVTYARRTDASCLELAAASAVAITEGRAWGKGEGTGLARSPDTDVLLSRSSEDATSTKEGATCFSPITTVTLPWSAREEEVESKEDDEPYQLERPLAPSLRPPWPSPELRPPPGYLVRSCSSGNVPSHHPPQTRLLHLRRRCPRRGGGVGRLPHLYSNPSGVSDTPRNHQQTSNLTPHLPPP